MSHASHPQPIVGNPLVRWNNVRWPRLLSIIFVHLLCLFAFVPAYFSWSGLVICLLGFYVFGSLGINVSWHRQLTHKAFESSKWLEYFLATLGTCCLQAGPLRWIGEHRMHHRDSDDHDDPHSPHRPLESFIWGHVGWLCFRNPTLAKKAYKNFTKDLEKEWFYRFSTHWWILIVILHAGLFYVAGHLVGYLWGMPDPYNLGISWVVWGAVVRIVCVWHITWSVNGAAHMWGPQAWDTGDQSRNNWWVALMSNGEGWHNNHHRFPRSARHGLFWWQFDLTWLTILLFQKVGLVWNVVLPSEEAMKNRRLNPTHLTEPAEAVTPDDPIAGQAPVPA